MGYFTSSRELMLAEVVLESITLLERPFLANRSLFIFRPCFSFCFNRGICLLFHPFVDEFIMP